MFQLLFILCYSSTTIIERESKCSNYYSYSVTPRLQLLREKVNVPIIIHTLLLLDYNYCSIVSVIYCGSILCKVRNILSHLKALLIMASNSVTLKMGV